ncbi:ankyrin repeat domain-containing protein [Streptomyces avidinii]|uniref:Ankyrin repeat protein n=1 Tax=Streptomyces avidinii TaxID=1895 RepID=A0ABS4LEW6_STRAV|nr:ankyrin repeat domain-containing protein [Streptomyces avidinii]MBP2040647.1 ankyrin repeat protein [Streptomyces avidinii]GGZ31269.1 hypothetical protein GCM10010343_68470 [Streptomyces avidinii]
MTADRPDGDWSDEGRSEQYHPLANARRLARALLDAGAEPGGPAGRLRHVPLVLAATSCGSGSPETVDLLLDRGADIEETMRDRTSLDWAARFGFPATVERLLERGAALTEQTLREVTQRERSTAGRRQSADHALPGTRRPDHGAVRRILGAATT